MRCALGTLFALALVAPSTGCKSQSTPMTNPFLTPDRVPPPSTRVLTPGAAAPYYPGDPLPGGAPATVPFGGTPAVGAPAGAMPPATAYPGAAPVTPPGGWGGSSPRADISPGNTIAAGESVRVPTDTQQMHFASTTAAPASAALPSTPAPAFTPHAGAAAPLQQAAFDETPPAPTPQRLQPREVTPAEYLAPVAAAPASAAATPARDGFRPQSSQPRPSSDAPASASGFRPPSSTTAAASDATARFAVGPNQEWLRGQLEYWPNTGEWSVRYMADGAVDQIGGRILIENPQVLGHLPPGEMVMVQGQVVGHPLDDATYRPAYRVAVVQRQQR